MTTLKYPYLRLHFLVLLWAFTAILGLLISLSYIEVVFYRTLFSALALAVIIAAGRSSFAVPPRAALQLLLTGVIIALHWMLFFGAARYANASVSLIGLSTTTLWTSFLEPAAYRRRISMVQVLFGLAVIGGLYIIYKDDFAYGTGLLMSLGSALMAAVFSVLNHRFVRRFAPLQISFYEMLGAWLGTLPFLWLLAAPGQQALHLPGLSDTGYLLILALVCTVYAYTESTRLLRQLSAFASNLVINLEPVYGIVLALLFFGERERMNAGFYLGASAIMIAVLAYPVVKRRFNLGA